MGVERNVNVVLLGILFESVDNKMVNTCVAVGCDTNYRTCKDNDIPLSRAYRRTPDKGACAKYPGHKRMRL